MAELTSAACSWDALPEELLEQIFTRLGSDNSILDLLRCGQVCVSWREVSAEVYYERPQIPFLLILDSGSTASLLNLSTNESTLCPAMVDDQEPPFVCSCTNGWLLTITLSPPYKTRLLNPFSGTRILDLPPLSSLIHDPRTHQNSIKKAITSSDCLDRDKDFVVLVIYGLESKLACCGREDAEWTALDGFGVSFADIMFYKGQFCAAYSDGKIISWQMSKPYTNLEIIFEPERLSYIDPRRTKYYLAESVLGEFLLVSRTFNFDDEDGFFKFGTYFDVYELDLRTKERRIKDLRKEVLFISNNGFNKSVAVSGEGLSCNCIYYIGKSSEVYCQFGFDYLGIYNLETNTASEVCKSDAWGSRFHWIMPRM